MGQTRITLNKPKFKSLHCCCPEACISRKADALTLRMSGLGFSMTCVRLNRWNRASLTKPSLSLYRRRASQIWVSLASPVTCLHTRDSSLQQMWISVQLSIANYVLRPTFILPSPERKSENPASVARSPTKVIPGRSSTKALTAASVTCNIQTCKT